MLTISKEVQKFVTDLIWIRLILFSFPIGRNVLTDVYPEVIIYM